LAAGDRAWSSTATEFVSTSPALPVADENALPERPPRFDAVNATRAEFATVLCAPARSRGAGARCRRSCGSSAARRRSSEAPELEPVDAHGIRRGDVLDDDPLETPLTTAPDCGATMSTPIATVNGL